MIIFSEDKCIVLRIMDITNARRVRLLGVVMVLI